MMVLIWPGLVLAAPDPDITGGSAVVGVSGVATPITDLQVAGTGNPTVPVKLRVTSGTLAMSTTTGLTFTGGSTGSTLQFSGTLTNVNAALSTLTYTRSGTGTDTLEVSLVQPGEVFFEDTGHLYEYVSYNANWVNANTNAQTRTKYGATGYLTTITSQAENDFVAARLTNAGWMGASDSASEGDWKWVTGPESGTSFWSGLSGGSAVGGRYSNWGTGEPNNAGDEDCAQFLTGGSGKWNDLPCSSFALPGYVVEYGSPSSPIEIASKNVSITTQAANSAPNLPSSLGGASYVNGSWGSSGTPTLSFSLSDPNTGNTVRYRVQIDDSAAFDSPVVDYTSSLAAQGVRSFTVGQAAGDGVYSVGSSGQSLTGGSYYWRVRAFDDQAAASSYVTANSGSVAFRVDVSGPTAPSSLVADAQSTDTTPTISWTGSSDSGAGLAATPYSIQWSQSPSFSSYSGASTGSTDYTLTSLQALSDGMWYFRVRAEDAVGNGSAYSSTFTMLIDTGAPTTPTGLTAISARTDATPTWTWNASSDAGVGLATIFPYQIEWSKSADFSQVVYSSLVAGTTFTHSTTLSDGTWYAKVRAIDGLNHQSEYSAVAALTIDSYIPPQTVPLVTAPRRPLVIPSVQQQVSIEPAVSQPAPVSSQAEDSPIYLNVFTEYTDGDGKPLTLQSGQVIYFTHAAQDHSATVKEMGEDYVVITIASTPTDVRIRLGQTVSHDVDDDDVNDISITFAAITDGKADLIFKQLRAESANSDSGIVMLWRLIADWWLWIAVTVAVIIAIWRRRRGSRA